jgi:hypothetical protein
MSKRTAALCIGVTAALLGLAAVAAQGAAAPWKAPRTPDGKPDLNGVWSTVTFTPLERPAQFADKAFFTEEEAKTYFAKAVQDEADRELEGGVHYPTSDYLMDKGQNNAKANLRTSLIVDPANGRQPPRTPPAQARLDAVRAAEGTTRGSTPRGRMDGPEDRSLFERCIRGTQGPPMLSAAFDNEVQIVQTPQHVMLLAQSMYDVRIIPTDGRPHLPENVRLLLGDSRGRWDGDTLVVDTTNFSDQTRFLGATRGLHLVERFTRTGADAIRYQVTVEDPATWTAPWSYELTMGPGGRLYEFACHENNLGLLNTLRGARETEKSGAGGAEVK